MVIPTARIPGENAKIVALSGSQLVVIDPAQKTSVWKMEMNRTWEGVMFDFASQNIYYMQDRDMIEREWKIDGAPKVIWKLPKDVIIDGDAKSDKTSRLINMWRQKPKALWRLITLQVSKTQQETMRIYEYSGSKWTLLAKKNTDGCYPHATGGCGTELASYVSEKEWDAEFGHFNTARCTGWKDETRDLLGDSCSEVGEKVNIAMGKLGTLSAQSTCEIGEETYPELGVPLVWHSPKKKVQILIPDEGAKYPKMDESDPEEKEVYRERPAVEICRYGESLIAQSSSKFIFKLFDLKTGKEIMDLKGYTSPMWVPDFKK